MTECRFYFIKRIFIGFIKYNSILCKRRISTDRYPWGTWNQVDADQEFTVHLTIFHICSVFIKDVVLKLVSKVS